MPFIHNSLLSIWIRCKSIQGIREKNCSCIQFPFCGSDQFSPAPSGAQNLHSELDLQQRQVLFPDTESHVLWDPFGRYYFLRLTTSLLGEWLQHPPAWLALDWTLVRNVQPIFLSSASNGECQKQTECNRRGYCQWKPADSAPLSFSP